MEEAKETIQRVGDEIARVIVGQRDLVDGLLVAGRSFSSDTKANDMVNLIPHCIVTGQAAGTAAVLSLQSGVEVREVNYQDLQKALKAQGVPLPEIPDASEKPEKVEMQAGA